MTKYTIHYKIFRSILIFYVNIYMMNIALYLNNLDEDYQIAIYKGIRDAAKKRNINVLCLQESFIKKPKTDELAVLPSHKLIKSDGIIMLSSVLLNQVSTTGLHQFSQSFKNIPCISLGHQIDGIPSILIKSRNSLKTLMRHLVFDHGYRNFLYVGGPKGHLANDIREHIFRNYLQWQIKNGLVISYKIINGDINEATAIRMLTKYIANNPEDPPDVIVAANDNMAIGCLKTIQGQSEHLWQNCAITGFDDIPRAKYVLPALTTIRQPLYEMGLLAMEKMYQLAIGNDVAALDCIDSTPIYRASCGCTANVSKIDEATEFAESSHAFMFNRYIQSDNQLRSVSVFGQRLMRIENLENLVLALRDFLSDLEVKRYHLLLYPEDCISVPNEAYLVFQKEGALEQRNTQQDKLIQSATCIENINKNVSSPSTLCLFPLDSGEEHLGIVLYDVDDQILPHMCSSAMLIAHAIKRMRLLEKEKERSRQLEHKILMRTMDLEEANKKLQREVIRRKEVEAEVLKISELERQRFSLDLHDDICQRLAGISMFCKGLSPTQLHKDLSTMIDETLQRTREYAHDSFPIELDSLGLKNALKNLCDNLATTNNIVVNFEWAASKKSPLTKVQDINVYRIIQEAVQNIQKHSKAQEVFLKVREEPGEFILEIEDNGIGSRELEKNNSLTDEPAVFNRGRRGSGLGLRSMQYRAHQINAFLAIHSVPTKGTMIVLNVPLESQS